VVYRFPTLIAIDRYNYFWDNTGYFDPADVNRGNYRHLDAQKLMLTKMFSDHQDHGLVHNTHTHTRHTHTHTQMCTTRDRPLAFSTFSQVNGTMVCALETTKPATIKPFLRRCGDKHMHEIPAYSLNEFHEVMKHYKEIEYVNIDDSTPPLFPCVCCVCCVLCASLPNPRLLSLSQWQPRRRRSGSFISSATACRV
jgi:hypothetical protein